MFIHGICYIYMFRFCYVALLIITLTTLLGGCAERNLNNLSKGKIKEINNGSKALILFQTTLIVPEGGTFTSFDKRMEMEWLNLSFLKEPLHTKNYQTVYIMPDLTAYNYNNIELYSVTPGHYKLKRLKYTQNNILSYTFEGGDIDTANFSVKGGEIVYIGNLIINISSISSDNFLKEGFNIQDNYNIAQAYMYKHYPELSYKLQKQLVILHKN